jgi:hypothetical protein
LPALLFIKTDPLFTAAALYAAAFAMSLGAAFAIRKQHPNGHLIIPGMLLFACCDICVGLNYLFPGAFYPLMWIFYLPSQALLAASATNPHESPT